MDAHAASPARIGRYVVQRVLGGGAMGIVFLAQDPLLKRPVAIKTVRGGTEERSILLERFRREAEVSARLNHPNIITVFDVGEDPDIGPFLAMEYVDGCSLAALIRSGLSLEAGMRLLIQGMGALMAAEEAGIAHRDVKPENILVDRTGRLKLMDFGIARSGESRLTQGGVVFGTPSYTAPELLVGAEASPVTDRYAFAIVAFEVFTGTLPFQGRTVGTTLYRIVHEPPALPATLDPALVQVFQRALAKQPRDRFQDLPTFLEHLLQSSGLPPDIQESLHTLLEENLPARARKGRSTQTFGFIEAEIPSTTAAAWIPPAGDETATTPVSPPPPVSPRRAWARWVALAALPFVLLGLALGILAWRRSTRSLDVFTSPPGAEVQVDGKRLGRTPLSKARVRGRHNLLRLELRGYQPLSRQLGPQDTVLFFTMEPLPWTLAVVTEPPGAEVFLNGARVGLTPLPALPIPAEGEQELVLRLEGHEAWRARLDRNAPFPETIRLTPEALPLRRRSGRP